MERYKGRKEGLLLVRTISIEDIRWRVPRMKILGWMSQRRRGHVDRSYHTFPAIWRFWLSSSSSIFMFEKKISSCLVFLVWWILFVCFVLPRCCLDGWLVDDLLALLCLGRWRCQQSQINLWNVSSSQIIDTVCDSENSGYENSEVAGGRWKSSKKTTEGAFVRRLPISNIHRQ